MINITVKTLDSQNHQFSVDENITVEQFKNHIADKVNVPATRQRIIYCGRVLQDSSKLAEYDVDGKVVHLVQRLPPTSAHRNVRSLTPPPDFNRAAGGGSMGFRGFERIGGNTVYMGMGSMSFPNIDQQQMIPPRETHTLSSSRLNVAKRMLKNAENVIRQLENPNGSNENTSSPEESIEEEMTPVIEARVIVPSTGNQPLDSNAILDAVQNTIFPANSTLDSDGPSTSSATQDSSSANQQSGTDAADNSNSQRTSERQREGARPRTRCRGTEMATLLNTLNQLQLRFAPFLARYQAFMQDDPQVATENLQETRQTLNRVSQVLHFLGHAYHSLSDIIIDVEQPPPRLLLCRPILIQPPALVQAGIPIQVEAQINLSADRPPTTIPNSTTTAPTSTPTTLNNVTTSAPSTASGEVNARPNVIPLSATANIVEEQMLIGTSSHQGGVVPPGFVGLPFMPAGPVRVYSSPLEIRTIRPTSNNLRPRLPTNNNNNTPTTTAATAPFTNQGSTPTSNAPSAPPTSAESNEPTRQNASSQPNFGPPNANLEFFMEVTPEALRGGNLIQSLIQLVGSQLGDSINQFHGENRSNGGQQHPPAQQSQQSQARSTQTNPTTSTHTRSTPRPHVHMTQQAVQGGFDPFLHCYSHHVTQNRPQRIVSFGGPAPRQHTPLQSQNLNIGSTMNSPNNAQSNQQSSQRPSGNTPSNIANHFEEILRNLPNIAEMAGAAAAAGSRQGQTPSSTNAEFAQMMRQNLGGRPPRGTPEGQSQQQQQQQQQQPQQQDVFSFVARLMEQNLPDILMGNGPTLDVMVQSFHPETYVQGESLIIDLIMLMLRNLRINDLFTISSGNMAPLQRQMDTIQGFFLTEVCQNDTTDAGVARATDRIIGDFTPIIIALESIPARENIDMSRTVDGFFRQRVPDIIRLAISTGSRGEDSQHFLTTVWRTARELLALAIHCCSSGQQGVENVVEQVIFSTISPSLPGDLFHWTRNNTRSALGTIFQNLEVVSSDIERYVVRNVPAPPPLVASTQNVTHLAAPAAPPERMQDEESNETEDMEIEEYVMTMSPQIHENVVVDWGSEPWHIVTPEEWAPIITSDVQKQKKQNSQPPFSDAYLSGMPSKRRKLINNGKPPGSLPQFISESIRQAVTSVGLASAAPLNVVAESASESPEIQTAYRTLLQNAVQTNLRNNEDFDPEKYPNVANYFRESSTE